MDAKETVAYLRSPKAIREQCGKIYAFVAEGRSPHFTIDVGKIDTVADFVTEVTKEAYPQLDVPYHSRWRHFDAGGPGRRKRLEEKLQDKTEDEIAMAKLELTIVSVLLDAGAGDRWAYADPESGKKIGKSEGLAIASLDMFLEGYFSGDPDAPCLVDPIGLKAIGKNELAAGMQVSAQNPLAGFDGRLGLLHRLGTAVSTHKKIFGEFEPRLGGIYEYLLTHSGNAKLPARKILATVLEAFANIWPGRITLAGANLGDVWKHGALSEADEGAGLVPFHKLSQWLTYSMIEPLEEAGLEVTGVDELTGLPEYRNGGLFIDMGVLKPKRPELLSEAQKPDSEAIVEWRALTVCLLDEVAARIRAKLGLSALELPLVKVLQGGTWTAGRRVAAKARADGAPPIRIVSDGTLF